MSTNPILRLCFVMSVWTLIGISAWQFLQFMYFPELYQSAVPPGFQARVFMGPLVIGGMALLFWFRFFRYERQGTRVFSAMMGFFMLVLLLVTLLTDPPANTIGQQYFWIYAFIGVIHIAIANAIGAREKSW